MREKTTKYVIVHDEVSTTSRAYDTFSEAWKELEFQHLYPLLENWQMDNMRKKGVLEEYAAKQGYNIQRIWVPKRYRVPEWPA